MKKLLSAVLALTVLLLTACGGSGNSGNSVTDKVGNANPNNVKSDDIIVEKSIFEDICGISSDKVVMTVNGNEITADMYLYCTVAMALYEINTLRTYHAYYGMFSELFDENGAVIWSGVLAGDMTVEKYIQRRVHDALSLIVATETMASSCGITLDSDDLALVAAAKADSVKSFRDPLIAQFPVCASFTDEELMTIFLKSQGLNEELFDRISTAMYLATPLTELVMTEGSAIYLEDADCNEYGYYADHILISTVDTTTRQPLSEEEIVQKTALAEDIIAQIEESDDPVALFESLADQYSEDPGRKTNPTGYIFTPGTMVAEFESATEALGYGEISGLVKSDYGYHIILRRDIAEGLALYPEEKTQFAEMHLSSLLALNIQNGELIYDEWVNTFEPGSFYKSFEAASQALVEQFIDEFTSEDNGTEKN